MAKEETKTEKPEVPIYTDGDMGNIMQNLQKLYAIDDAIYNQGQLNRPPGYIQPLHAIRKSLSDDLIKLTSKGVKEAEKPT